MFLRRHVAEHRRAEPADHRRADGRRDVVVAWRNIGGERAKRIERGFVAGLQLAVHVLLDLVHRDMAGAFDHHLNIVFLRNPVEFAQCLQFGELRRVIGIRRRTGPQTVAQRERHVIAAEDFADLFEMRVEEIFPDDAPGTIWRESSRRAKQCR